MNPSDLDAILGQIEQDGYCVLPAVYSSEQARTLRTSLVQALEADPSDAILRSEDGSIFGARNLSRVWPPSINVWRQPPLPEVFRKVMGPGFGLVRILYFDKPAEQSWALPWHRDRTVAVREHRPEASRFRKPTTKAGVPHLEAPNELLERMLTLRIHLDDVTPENGPLQVLPGSHREATPGDRPGVTILANAGDVLLMRPLISHCSNKSLPGTRRQRRILHFEFAADPVLPEGFAWHEFHAGAG